jgi:hypothetical protein
MNTECSQQLMKTFGDIIAQWPSAGEFASDIGLRRNHVQTMKVRASIPPEYWLRIVRCAAHRGFRGVSMELLASIAEGNAKSRRAA